MSAETSRSPADSGPRPCQGADTPTAAAGLGRLRSLMGPAWPELAARMAADLSAERPALAAAAPAAPEALRRAGHVLAGLGGTAGDEALHQAARALQAAAEAGAEDLPARAAATLHLLDGLLARLSAEAGGPR